MGLTDVLPLTPLQEGLFFLSKLDDEGIDVYTVQQLLESSDSLTGAYLSRRTTIPNPAVRRPRTKGRDLTGLRIDSDT